MQQLGPKGVAVFGSGQYTIMEGYAAAKLMKAGFRSNNLDPNARLCMASAVAAFMETFGIDEPAGNYDDMHHSDTIVLWGANMAEMHPVLWSKITDRKLADTEARQGREPHDLHEPLLEPRRHRDRHQAEHGPRRSRTTSSGRSCTTGPSAIDWDFVNQNCVFATGYVDIGYGLRPKIDHPKYKKEELDTASKEAFKIMTKDEAAAMASLGYQGRRQDGDEERRQGRCALGHQLRGLQERTRTLHPRLRGRSSRRATPTSRSTSSRRSWSRWRTSTPRRTGRS